VAGGAVADAGTAVFAAASVAGLVTPAFTAAASMAEGSVAASMGEAAAGTASWRG
jgi:hypothetical protein